MLPATVGMLPDSLEEDRAVLAREFWNAFDVVAGRATVNMPAAASRMLALPQ
jgi:hypothetical protein